MYGPFTIGDDSRGTKTYLVPLTSKDVIVAFSVSYNDEALGGSSSAIKALKASFDKDFPIIIKNLTTNF